MMEYIIQNLPFFIPQLLLSIGSWIIVLEKVGFVLKNRKPSNLWFESVLQEYALLKPYHEKASENLPISPELRLIHFYENEKSSSEFTFDLIRRRAENELQELDKGLSYLPGIANIATLIGLFGTVTGMISTFFSFRQALNPDPSLLAGGISQALLTTAGGLFVAIPALFFSMIFQARLKYHQNNLEALLEIWYRKHS